MHRTAELRVLRTCTPGSCDEEEEERRKRQEKDESALTPTNRIVG